METTASTAQHAFGAGPRGPNPAHGPQPGQGPRHPGHPGPYGVPRPEDQPPHQQPHHHIQHSRPFFYIHPSQPYPSQPYPSQPYPSQPYPSQPFPSQPFPSQPFPSQPFPSQPFPSQPFPSQPFPSQPFPSQPFPSQPYPSQPFPSQLYPSALPYQWPMPYNPYCGFPGMGGYGMMIPSPFQPSPYMEPPGYILPHSQLHLADYRRMINPHYHTTHYPQTMAYHARRFRYQHNAPATSREMINSEVQTEPTLGAARSDPKLSNADSSMKSHVQTNSESGSDTSCTAAQSLSPASAVQEVMSKSPAYQDVVLAPTPNNTPISTRSAAPQKGSFVFQTEVEELRLECRSTPTGINILHSHETSELCTAHSVSATDEDLVQLCSSSSLHHHHKVSQGRMLHGQEGMGLVGEEGGQCLQQACTDILLMDGACSSGGPDNFLALDDCDSFIAKTLAERPGNSESDMDYRVVVQSHTADGPQFTSDDGELSGNGSKSVYFKILHLPFDMQYLEELRKIEASVWSASLAPYVPSAEFMIQQGLMEPHREALSPVVMEEVPMVEEVPTAEVVPMVEVEVPGVEKVPTAEVVSLVEGVPIAESPSNEDVLLAEMVPNVMEVPAISSPNETDNAPMSPETSQKRGAVSDLDQDASFGGLPTYRPSTSWLGDFGNVYYHSKMPSDVEEQRKILRGSPLKVSSPKRKPNHDQEPHCVSVTTTAPLRLKGEGCRPGDKVDRRSYSDQEFCANRTFNVNTVTSGGHKRERVCARCLTTKCRVNKRPGSPGPGLDAPIVKRQGVPVPPWEEYILAQTCAACKCLARRRATRKGSGSDVPSGPQNEETEGETSENSSCRAGSGPKLRDPRRPQSSMKRHSEKCPMGPHSKLREKNCSCEEPHRPPAAVLGGPRRHPHGDVIRERNEENLGVCVSVPLQDKWRNQHQDQCYLAAQKSQQEKLWKLALSKPDNTESNIKLGPRDLIKQKKHISQSQGLHRKDTRC
uniref:uncharacterized protein LOC124039695 isoform X3 n=1 Tax=Oncorhynchus gorbuscha TaxID=8017 RepID=UPI001EAECCE4|nr:uncharacterized protein LOC124039695 isoform X3 [Oncorhynchus gorbuscha]